MREIEITISLYVEDDDDRDYPEEICDSVEALMCPEAEAEGKDHVCKTTFGMVVKTFELDRHLDRVDSGRHA